MKVERPRQRCRARIAVAGARIDEHAGAGRRGKLLRECAPQADAAEPLVQHHDGRRRIGPRPDHAVFEPHAAARSRKPSSGSVMAAARPMNGVTMLQKLGKALLDGIARSVDFGFGARIVGAARFEDGHEVGHGGRFCAIGTEIALRHDAAHMFFRPRLDPHRVGAAQKAARRSRGSRRCRRRW